MTSVYADPEICKPRFDIAQPVFLYIVQFFSLYIVGKKWRICTDTILSQRL